MTGWIVLGFYCAGFVFTARKAPAVLIQVICEGSSLPVELMDRLMGRTLGCLIALFWPVLAFGALLTWRLPKTDREIREELAERERRISDLERENARLRAAQERL